jgi:UDP-N-acetylmuramate dehydrogenase
MNMADTNLFAGLRGELKENEPMARHVSWRAGGPARRFYIPADLDDLAQFLPRVPPEEPLLFLGLGSNLLVRDGGWRGTVVLMHRPGKRPSLKDGRIYAEAGTACAKVAHLAVQNNLGDAEFLVGIPGTVGGALVMNAGCYGGETWDIVDEAVTINRAGELRTRPRDDFHTGYRQCELKDAEEEEWFAAAWFKLPAGDWTTSRQIMSTLIKRRVASQPLQLPNAGSVFRNLDDEPAAKLIEACDLKGLEHGGARISKKHANFIVNPQGKGTAADIEWLIEHVIATVKEQQGVHLKREVHIVGDPL